jgi:hypothetical protein
MGASLKAEFRIQNPEFRIKRKKRESVNVVSALYSGS